MEFKIDNVNVYGLEKSIKRAKYPMSLNVDELNCDDNVAKKLSKNKPGTGHPNFLNGIIVQFDLTAPQYFWLQWLRYRFTDPNFNDDIISSQSKMHRITKMDIKEQCNEYVLQEIIDIMNDLIWKFNNFDELGSVQKENGRKELFQQIISNCPMGLMLTAGYTTNYLQLKNMYFQRGTHKLEEWSEFCNWIETLPHSELITNSK